MDNLKPNISRCLREQGAVNQRTRLTTSIQSPCVAIRARLYETIDLCMYVLCEE